SWHDKYLEWVCGFANAQGGGIYIGKEDSGKVTGVEDYKKLMEDIPNKIRNHMGISADVNLLQEDDKYYIEIVVQPYSVPISLHGQYFYRSGSVKMELTGNSLNEFLLKRSGLTWDEVTEPRATFDDIDERSFRMYLEMSKEKDRLPDVEGLTMEEIFDKLRLTKNGELTRAAIILFGKDPRRFSTNAFVKIGRFKGDADLRFQDVEEGNLIVLLKSVLERLDHKYLTRSIEFKGMLRLEHSEYPIPALREMLLNALVHRKYMGSFIQIRVYDDKITIWNDGALPEEITLESLKHVHSSHPRNPLIADVCFKGGLIDSWGRGTVRIIETCKEAGLPEPELTERDGGFLVTLFKDNLTEEQLLKLGLNERQIKAVQYVKERRKITNKEYQEINDISNRTATNELKELVEKFGLLGMSGAGAGTFYELL
ncbi:putative DNA binding domain-containing protein, partial [Bacteroidales bacterium OttesenSCG-928-B11]|nr:putative DNA binding domain-containing protein [Bacteroidales bacterium OttesenSCG-928-E04]MDL2313317.1 putative DNA binding domain-containing protein [Bacteroidales bacterium OttesenSCG-928-B11]